jgi:uncharacterized membrane protein
MKLKIFLLIISLTFIAGNSTLCANENGLTFKENLYCTFTEPFYSVDIENGKLLFRDIYEKTIPFIVTKIQQSVNDTNTWVLKAESSKDGNVIMFIQETNSCSDGMSEFIYKYDVVFHSESKNMTFSGCAHRINEAK